MNHLRRKIDRRLRHQADPHREGRRLRARGPGRRGVSRLSIGAQWTLRYTAVMLLAVSCSLPTPTSASTSASAGRALPRRPAAQGAGGDARGGADRRSRSRVVDRTSRRPGRSGSSPDLRRDGSSLAQVSLPASDVSSRPSLPVGRGAVSRELDLPAGAIPSSRDAAAQNGGRCRAWSTCAACAQRARRARHLSLDAAPRRDLDARRSGAGWCAAACARSPRSRGGAAHLGHPPRGAGPDHRLGRRARRARDDAERDGRPLPPQRRTHAALLRQRRPRAAHAANALRSRLEVTLEQAGPRRVPEGPRRDRGAGGGALGGRARDAAAGAVRGGAARRAPRAGCRSALVREVVDS